MQPLTNVIGGTIGTGLFIGSGSVLAETGPAPLFISYIIMSGLIWILTMDLAEMASYMPIRGMTIPYLVQRFAEPSLAFATGKPPNLNSPWPGLTSTNMARMELLVRVLKCLELFRLIL